MEIAIIIGIIIIAGFLQISKETNDQKKIQTIPDFSPSATVRGFGGKHKLMLDKKRRILCFFEGGRYKKIPFDNIFDVQLLQDGSDTARKASYITLSIGLRNMSQTVLNINCYSTPFGMQAKTTGLEGAEYRESLRHAHEMMNLVNYVLDDNRRQQAQTAAVSQNVQSSDFSVADEIKKLSDLKSEGIISEEEFNKQKERLLK